MSLSADLQVRHWEFVLKRRDYFLSENREDFVLTHDQELLAIDLDFLAGDLPKRMVSPSFIERDALAVVLHLPAPTAFTCPAGLFLALSG